MSSLLLSERPLVVLPSLVKRVGLTRAIILQQIHWLLQQPRSGKMIDGRKWVWGDYDKWRELYFPFWSRRTLQRHILRLEEEGFLISAQHNVLNWDRTKYYRLNYSRLNAALPHAGAGVDAWADCAGDEDGAGCADGTADGTDGAPVGRSAGGADGAENAALPSAPVVSAPVVSAPVVPAPTVPAPAAPDARPAAPRTAPDAAQNPAAPAPTNPAPRTAQTAHETAGRGSPPAAPAFTAPPPISPAPASDGARTCAAPTPEPRPAVRRPAPADAPAHRPPQDESGESGGSLAHAAIFGQKFDPAALPPPIRAFWDLHGRLPNHAQRRMIEDAKITDVRLWRRCLSTWAGRGYNPMRIDGPLEWYAAPDLMDARREGRNPAPPPASAGPIVLDVSPEIAALLAGKPLGAV